MALWTRWGKRDDRIYCERCLRTNRNCGAARIFVLYILGEEGIFHIVLHPIVMQIRKKSFLYYWLPAVLWMGIIFALSSRTRVSVSEQYWSNFLFFKTLHVIEYAVLYALTIRALAQGAKPTNNHYLKSAIITIIYAISDEVHQTFVPTRQGTLRDVFIDTLGVSVAYLLIKRFYNKVQLFFV